MWQENKISVVIPCRNEEKNIENCVRSIYESNYDLEKIEVLVVDGMSEDNTRSILETLQKEFSSLKVIDNPHKLTPYAFNLGVINSTGSLVQIVGSRNVLDKNYLKENVKILLSKTEVACVGGNYIHQCETKISKYITWAMESKFGVGSSNYRTLNKSSYVDTVGVPMYRKEIFDSFGLFDERLTRNQDDDFNYRLTQAGKKIFYNHEVNVWYYVRGDFKKLFKQFMQYGYWKVFVSKKHKSLTTLRQIVPSLFILFLILVPLLIPFFPFFKIIYTFTLSLYLVLGFLSGLQYTKNVLELFPYLYAIFILHTSYGLGFLLGVIDFLILKKKPSKKMNIQTT